MPELEALFDGAPCGLLVTREDGTILRANQTFGAWMGISGDALLGRRFQELLAMGGRIFHQTHWAPLMRMQGSVAEVKLDLVHADKHIVTMLLNGVRREVGDVAFFELALFCTTDRDKYERELVSARELAEDLLHKKTAAEAALRQTQAELEIAYSKSERRASFAEEMVAIVSHDLKNPLTAIKMATEILAKSESTPKEARMLSHIGRSVDRAERMIADLLDLALTRAGRGIAVSLIEVDVHELITRAVDELRVAFPKVTLLQHSLGAGRACLDADRIQQVVGNLVANSVAYGDHQRPITISVRREGSDLCISVLNYGAIIPEPLQAGLFEPMTRGAEPGSEARSVGLGLFIVREVAIAHGGRVSVRSTLQAGTQFDVHIPLGF